MRFFSIALCVILVFSFSSCEYNETQSQDNKYQYENIEPPTQPSIDWDALKEDLAELESGLNDALEQIESTHTYVVTYSIDLEYNNSVGNEWRYGVSYNDEYIASSSKIVIADSPTKIDLVAFATELDEWNDHGTTFITFDALSIGQKQSKWATVIVRENQGRYTGNTAKWYFEITIERID